MKVLISGASGLVGRALTTHLSQNGYQIGRLLRKDIGNEPYWNIEQGIIELKDFDRPQAIIHLAGENIGNGRWTQSKKRAIVDSRINSTKLLADFICKAEYKPEVLISASAIGFYGETGARTVDETSEAGSLFVSKLAYDWEACTQPVAEAGVRVVNIRTGLVLSKAGGVLRRMYLPFRFGLGGVIGSGEQYISWISINDMVSSLEFILHNRDIKGAINLVSPNAVTNREFTKTLGSVLKRPTLFWVPAFLARMMFGEMADELLLSSTRVAPTKLQKSGYIFQDTDLEQTLKKLL